MDGALQRGGPSLIMPFTTVLSGPGSSFSLASHSLPAYPETTPTRTWKLFLRVEIPWATDPSTPEVGWNGFAP
jgi:hypothetical protein